MTTKKKATKHEEKKTTSLNQPLPDGMLGTKEGAAKLKIEPRHLRVILRASGHGTGGERYMWKESDLPKLAAMVKEHDAKVEAVKK